MSESEKPEKWDQDILSRMRAIAQTPKAKLDEIEARRVKRQPKKAKKA
jgi:hypothetical protein